MFPLIFLSLCVHKISCVQHLTSNHLRLERHEKICANTLLKENFCALQVFCVRSSHDLCACAQLRGNIDPNYVTLSACLFVMLERSHTRQLLRPSTSSQGCGCVTTGTL